MKTLIFYATAGIGHKKVAIAIKEAFDERGQKGVLLEDVLDYTNQFFKTSYCAIYIFLVRHIPALWGFFYYTLDNPCVYALIKPLRRLTNYINSKRLVGFLLAKKPETAIVTHFFPLEVIANLKKKGMLSTRLISVITDYKSHTFWISKYVDLYIAGSLYTKNDLIKRGIPAGQIKAYGIPCTKSFSEKHNRDILCEKLGLELDKKTIFILGGGFGVGPIKSIVSYLDELEEDFQGIVVCGYNKKLYNVIEKTARTARHNFKVYGFVNNVDELMAVSDVLVSKPGGITVTEALSLNLPMIIVDPIPGQEVRNYKFLEKHDAALKINSPKEIINVMKGLLNSKRLNTLRDNIKKIRLADSAERIVDEVNK